MNDTEGGISTFLREVQSEKALDEIITFSSDEQSKTETDDGIRISVS